MAYDMRPRLIKKYFTDAEILKVFRELHIVTVNDLLNTKFGVLISRHEILANWNTITRIVCKVVCTASN